METTNSTIIKAGVFAVAAIAGFLAVGAFFAHADSAPSVNATIRNTSDGVITSALVGANVHSVVQIASSTSSTTPQGTVDFNVYGNTSCSGTPTTQSNVALVNGFATSSASTVSAGGLSYKMHYDGDVNNIAADSACMPLTSTSNSAAISIGLSSNAIQAGQSVNGTSSLSGVTSNASGTVAYTVYSNSSCTTPYGGAGNVTVTNGSVPNSPPFQFVTPGTYYWQVVYSGDSNNNAATSTCGNGIVTVQAVAGKNSPTISTTLSSTSIQTGTSVHANSALSGATSVASGTVAYKVFTDNACSNLFTNAGVKNVTSASIPNSDNVQFNTAGTYYWRTIYSGDSQNNAATSTCGAALTVVAAGGTTTPPAGSGTISGVVYNDKNKNDVRDSGEEGLAGFTVNLYNSANFNGGKYDPVFMSATSDSNGNYSFTGLGNGTYSVEQLVKNGWKQTTDDFASVAITSGAGVSSLNFGDAQSANAGQSCKERKEHVDHGKHKGWAWGKHKKDCSDNDKGNHATSTKPWWNNASSTHSFIFRSLQDLGGSLHLGVIVGKNNNDKDKHNDHKKGDSKHQNDDNEHDD